MLDAGGGVVPGDDGGLGGGAGKGDEVLGLGDVDGLLVHPGREADDGARPVAQRHSVQRGLHRRERLSVPSYRARTRHAEHAPLLRLQKLLLRHGWGHTAADGRWFEIGRAHV